MKAKKAKITRSPRTRHDERRPAEPASAYAPAADVPAVGAPPVVPASYRSTAGLGTCVLGFVLAAGAGAILVGVAPVREAVWAWLQDAAALAQPPQALAPTAPSGVVVPVPQRPALAPRSELRPARNEPDAGAAVGVSAWGEAAPPSEQQAVDAGPPVHHGPWFAALVPQASVYSAPEWTKEKRIGYLRRGSIAPLAGSNPIRTQSCELGWFRLVGGGYVCGKHGTLDVDHPKVRLGPAPPNLDEILPYRYGWNTTMGTPLYRSVPSREQMAQNEPYLLSVRSATRSSHGGDDDRAQDTVGGERGRDGFEGSGTLSNTFLAATDPGATMPDRRLFWWQQTTASVKPDIRLADLVEENDNSVVARRLVRGFYVAIDKSFAWNGRDWYETTSSLVAPADRFSVAKPASMHGLELTGADVAQQVGFVLGTNAKKYRMVGEPPRHAAADGGVERFTAVRLTGETVQVGGIVYRLTTEGWWMKGVDGTYTDPGPPPDGLAPSEKWIDVNLSRQTLIAFEGTVPVFASLVSTGRHARDPADKAHDHRTVQGTFRVREKHLATTMDGDGPAPGDMPYSIEDVPYVMYFEGSYALHAAFWHTNFGHEQSHGCVNLAPLDAKRLFTWADPPLPQGWHGVLASKDHPGTTVVVHE